MQRYATETFRGVFICSDPTLGCEPLTCKSPSRMQANFDREPHRRKSLTPVGAKQSHLTTHGILHSYTEDVVYTYAPKVLELLHMFTTSTDKKMDDFADSQRITARCTERRSMHAFT